MFAVLIRILSKFEIQMTLIKNIYDQHFFLFTYTIIIATYVKPCITFSIFFLLEQKVFYQLIL